MLVRWQTHDLLLCISLLLLGCEGQKHPEKNKIQTENNLVGSADWQLTQVKTDTCQITEPFTETTFCRTREIEAYVSHTSISHGETLQFYVSTDPIDSFSLQIYRMGYYAGKGARMVQDLGSFQGASQITPDSQGKGLIECTWTPDLAFEIPTHWLSGVYLGKLTTISGNWQCHAIFIVKDDRQADFLFQCSDFTWQSYNRWPAWRSLYDGKAHWGYTPWFTDAGTEVGFDRPYSFYLNSLPAAMMPSINGSGEFLLWEFPLAFWMEKNGYDVTYISNLDTHRDKESLLRGRAFLSVGHDEYWTPTMYDNVTYARDSGVNLLFLSGNSVSGEIYLRPASSGQPDRIFGRTERFSNEDLLMGAKSYGVGLADWICRKPAHWIFEGTGMKEGDRIPDLVGWEYHGYPLPDIEGLQVLASGPLAGASEDSRYAATYYECEKGNFVFNAATCWWSMVLSSPPGFPFPQNPKKLFTDRMIDFTKDDLRVQRMTENLFHQVLSTNSY